MHFQGISNETVSELSISAKDSNANEMDATNGKAYIFDCRYSTLCRQIVTDDQGRIQEFDFKTDDALVSLKADNMDPELGIDSVIAIPIEDWSLDLVTPNAECIRKDGACIAADFPNPPDESRVLPFNQVHTFQKITKVHSFLKQCFARSSIDIIWWYLQLIFKLTSADIS